ncbi:MAG: hypothetical protein ACSHX3_05090 [Litorimonas sp.]
MTFNFTKKIITCVALSTVCLTSTAHAADAFNKFATQPAAVTQNVAKTTPYTVVTYSKVQTFNKKRTVKRVVEPVTTNATFFVNNGPTTSTDRFNKMATYDQSFSREMPVVNKRAVTIR